MQHQENPYTHPDITIYGRFYLIERGDCCVYACIAKMSVCVFVLLLQMLSKETVNSTVDIYAFGCMVMKLVDGRRQYKNEVSMANGIQSHVYQIPSPKERTSFKTVTLAMAAVYNTKTKTIVPGH